MALENLTSITREEAFLDKIAGETVTISPITRLERFLDAIANSRAGELPGAPDPITRREYFLKKIADSFAGGGGGLTNIVHDKFDVSGASSTQKKEYEFTYTPEYAPSGCLVIISAINPTAGQFSYYVGSAMLMKMENTNAAPTRGMGMNTLAAYSLNNNNGLMLYTVKLTGAPSDPLVTCEIWSKTGTQFSVIDGSYNIDAYIF